MICAIAEGASLDSLVIAAYRLGPYTSWEQAKLRFYGQVGRCSNVFATNADKLANSVFLGHVTSDYLMLNHSASPIFASLLNPLMAHQWVQRCKSGAWKPGVRNFGRGWTPKIRQGCTECVHEDQAAWGTGHWRVQHQLPGVRICTAHRKKLWQRCTCGQFLGDEQYPTLPGEPCRSCRRTSHLEEEAPVSAGQEALTHLYIQLLRGEGPSVDPQSRQLAILAKTHRNSSDRDRYVRDFLKFFACRDVEELGLVLRMRVTKSTLTNTFDAHPNPLRPTLSLAVVAYLQAVACDQNNC